MAAAVWMVLLPAASAATYLVAVAVVAVFAFAFSSTPGMGLDETPEDEVVSSLAAPELRLLNYIRYLAAAYLGVSIAIYRDRVFRRQLGTRGSQ